MHHPRPQTWLSLALFLAGVAAWSPPAWARRNGIGAQGCDGCHNGGQSPTVTLTASPANAAAGQPLTLTITVSQTNGPVAGFYLTTDTLNNGMFRAIEAGTLASSFGVTHTTPRTGSGGVTTFKAEWSAAMATGVQFGVYALSANGDGTSRGDGAGSATLAMVVGCTGATYYLDQDGDGFGTADPAYPIRKDCSKPANYALVAGDCNDFNGAIHPGAVEQCDLKDNNCDGKVDEAVVNQMYCEDKDGDGHGVIGLTTKLDCKPSAGFGDCAGDCNDNNNTAFPGATEVCDGRDNNCNGSVDEGVRKTCGVGWCRRYAEGCTSLCTPGEPLAETCNFFDDDCDGQIDNGDDAALCGGPGLVCVLGSCIAGTPVPGEMGGTGGSKPAGSGGTGGRATPGNPSGGSSMSGAGGQAASDGGGGGCSVILGGPTPSGAAVCLAVAVALWLSRARTRRRRPLPARRWPR